MTYKWIGAILVLSGCSFWGFKLSAAYIRQERNLEQLYSCLQQMRWELCYRLSTLPDLFASASQQSSGSLQKLFVLLSEMMIANAAPDVSGCMNGALSQVESIPPKARRILRHLGKILGKYDLEGQIQGMDAVIEACRQAQESLSRDLEIRIRSYRTLGICAGVALAILFI